MSTLAQFDPEDNDRRILEGEAHFLRVLLASATGTGTLAEATPPEFRCKPYPNGGKWRGSIPRRLAGRGIIGAIDTTEGRFTSHRSPRTPRRGGIATVWRLLDAGAARRRLSDLNTYLAATRRQRTLFDDLDDDEQHIPA